MVIPLVEVMARRRKGAGGSKAAAKSQAKAPRKSNGVVEEKINGSLVTSGATESEESCVSQEDNAAPLSCRTPIGVCPPDPSLGEPPPESDFKINSSPQHIPMVHKKFRKFRHMLEVGDSLESQQNCVIGGKTETDESQVSQVSENQGEASVGGETVIEQQLDVANAQEVPLLWEEEVVEETVVCEGMEVELEDTRSQDNMIVEEVECQGNDSNQIAEARDSECSNEGRQVMAGFPNKYSQETVESGVVLPHNRLVKFSASHEPDKNVVLAIGSDCNQIEDSQDSQISGEEMEGLDDEKLLNPIVVKSVIQDGNNKDINVLENPDSQNTGIKNEFETPGVELVDRIPLPGENLNETRSLIKGTEIGMSGSTVRVLVDSKSYSECLAMNKFQVKSEYETKLGLGLKDLKLNSNNLPSDSVTLTASDKKLNTDKKFEVADVVSSLKVSEEERKLCTEEEDTSDDAERKTAPAFRSRSGSTDTTGSESSSNCSSGVRRSSRIRSIGIMKQKTQNRGESSDKDSIASDKEVSEAKSSEGRYSSDCCSGTDTQSDKENVTVSKISAPMSSPATVHGLVTPAIPSYDVDSCKPVKVKSRWRRSSELEMGGSRSSDSELAATPPTPNLSPRPTIPIAPSLSPRPAAPATPTPIIRPVLPSTNAVNTTVLSAEQPVSTDGAKKDVRSDKKEKEDFEMEEKLRNFCSLTENEYLTDRSTSKEAKRMVCDCFLTKDEIARGELGCGEDCLNRLLMIECGSRCPVGDRCTNRRFQKQDYAKCEIFKTEKKGFGLRALEDLAVGSFVAEYVGEVLDPKEFRRRAKDYAKDKNRHYYFMALKSDAIIDATMKGNISRFINHSCEPNAETQKWTVNGELRIGFFCKRPIAAGEEITFDYQLQRYGKEAQRCHCESSVCRGWIGEDPEKEKRDKKERKEREIKKKKEERRRDVKEFLEDMDLEEEIEKLCISGLKNRTHTLTLSRLMVRAEDIQSRIQILKLLQDGEPACRRLFLDYHGLRLIWSWMMDVGSNKSTDGITLKMEILQTLSKLPIPNKTALQDSKVMAVVEKWALLAPNELAQDNFLADGSCDGTDPPNAARQEVCKKGRSPLEEESGSDHDVSKPRTDAVLPVIMEVPDEETLQGLENEKQLVDGMPEKQTEVVPGEGIRQVIARSSESDDETSSEVVEKIRCDEESKEDNDSKERTSLVVENDCEDKTRTFKELASGLLSEWTSLKEVFRIPKKERIEQMKEHEREADRGYKEYLDKENHHEKQSYDRHWRQDRFRNDHDKRDRKRTRESPDSDRMRKGSRFEERNLVPIPRMSKHERRQLFALKVAQEEEEERQRRQQQEIWRHHEDRCLALGLDPHVSAVFDPQTGFPCYYDPASNTLQPYPPQDPNVIPPAGMPPPEMGPPPIYNPNNPMSPHLPGMPPPPGAMPPQGAIPPPGSMPPPGGMPPQGNMPPPAGMPPQGGLPPPGGMPPQGGIPPHGTIPPHGGMPPQGGIPPQGGMPSQGIPNMPPQGMPPHMITGNMPPGGYDPNHPHVPHQPHQPHHPHPPHQPLPFDLASHPVGGIPPHHHPPPPYPDHRGPPPMDPNLTEFIPLPSGPQPPPVYQQQQQHNMYNSAPTTGPGVPPVPSIPVEPQQPLPQPHYHQVHPIQQTFVPAPPPPLPPPVRLPPKWKSAKDSEGRTYYYHVKTRISQWEPPEWTESDHQPESESSSDTSDDDDDDEEEEDSSSTEEEEEAEQEEKVEEDEDEEEEEEAIEEKEDIEDEEAKERAIISFPSVVEEEMELGDQGDSSLSQLDEPKKKDRRREGLVQERIISPRREEDRQDMKKYREIKEKLRRKKEQARSRERSERSKKRHRDGKPRSSSKSSEKPVTVAADTSSDAARKIKDQFRLHMAGVIVQYLNPYRKPDCKAGRITNTEDFKHLARKLTHFVMLKELKHCRSVDDLECNDNVKHKARDFIKKYMAKFGAVYQRPKDDD